MIRNRSITTRLLVNYNIMIGLAEAAWYPIIPIPIPMMPFMIPLPLKLLQGDFDGQRYLNDERMILPTKMKELDEARTKVKELQAAIINKIKTSYLEAKQAEEAYIQALRKEELARRAEEEARTSYAFGTLPEDKWEEIQKASEEAEKAAFDAYVAYRDALTKLDLESAGGVMPMKIDGILPWGSVEDDGLAPLNQAPETPVAPKGEWFVKTTVENMKSEFSIKVEDPASFGAEQYALKTRRDYQIGKMQPLDGKIGHLDFVFANIKDLRVYFYNGGGDIVAEARLDGYGTQGQLQITTR